MPDFIDDRKTEGIIANIGERLSSANPNIGHTTSTFCPDYIILY